MNRRDFIKTAGVAGAAGASAVFGIGSFGGGDGSADATTQSLNETATATATHSPTETPSPTQSPTATDTSTAMPSDTPTATETPTATQSPSPTQTPTDTPSPTQSPSPTPTETPVPTPRPRQRFDVDAKLHHVTGSSYAFEIRFDAVNNNPFPVFATLTATLKFDDGSDIVRSKSKAVAPGETWSGVFDFSDSFDPEERTAIEWSLKDSVRQI